ncbi:MAG: hypothetical protein H7844_00565 [Nitrospirae bacterium YQR-1]
MPTYVEKSFIGSGDLYLDILDSTTGVKTGEFFLGNVAEFKLATPEISKAELKSKMRESYGKVLKSVITEFKQSLSFSLSDYTKENLKLAFMGDNEDLAQSSGSVTGELMTAHSGKYSKLIYRNLKSSPDVVVKANASGTWAAAHAYALGDIVKPAGSSYFFEVTTAGTSDDTTEPTWPTVVGNTVVDGTVTWTCRKYTFVKDTDYEVDYEIGRIYVIESGDIEDGQSLLVDYSYDSLTGSITNISTEKQIEAFVRFIGLDRANSRNCEVELFKVALTPGGDVDLISEKFTTLNFSGEILTTDAGTGRFLLKD